MIKVLLKCKCGKVQGVIHNPPGANGKRNVCLCADCQAFAHYLGSAQETLDENGGTDIFPVAPVNLRFTLGMDKLKCLRLTGRGMIRWYADCCKTPVANSMPSPQFPFAGVVHNILHPAAMGKTLDQAIGPISARIQGKSGIGKLPPDASLTVPLHVMRSTLRFLLLARIRGQHAPSPFFDNAGKPSMAPYILTPAERESLRKFCGPHPTA